MAKKQTVALNWREWIIFGVFTQNQNQNVSVFALVGMYLGRKQSSPSSYRAEAEAEAEGTCRTAELAEEPW